MQELVLVDEEEGKLEFSGCEAVMKNLNVCYMEQWNYFE